ncbi:MAG: hypothetical protein LBQ73_11325 [Tannerellaceae bacterium]|jgi:hypothetical protein|nr:hypothetical protein [Tannerellaceae bacterium]
MEGKHYMVYIDGEGFNPNHYTTKEDAQKKALELAKYTDKKVFVAEMDLVFVPKEINSAVDSYESACAYLGREHDFATCTCDNNHHKAMVSLFKLVTIAEAWNKADGFVPDFANEHQYKWVPNLKYKEKLERFCCEGAYISISYAIANFGSRLCFKTEERAEQFGWQFIDLWNKFLLIRE